MRRSLRRMLPRDHKLYRVALYGRSGAGKTCFLAALNLYRTPHPKGYTCRRVCELPGRPPPNGPLHGADIRGDPVRAFHAGDRWLSEAEEALAAGDVPRFNDATEAGVLALYEFTAPDRGLLRVETVDYSGELVSAVTRGDLIPHLRRHLDEMDAILVLAEAEPSLPGELHLLRNAFTALASDKRGGPHWDCPVAVVLNKWDRCPPGETVDSFLKRSEGHRTLTEAVCGAVGRDNFQVFHASAFGEHRRDGADRPARVEPMPSFGLEDPFVWAVRRRDELDHQELVERMGSARFLRWVNFLNPIPPLLWTRTAADLVRRFPKGTKERQDANARWWRSLGMTLTRSAAAAVVLAVALIAAETWALDKPDAGAVRNVRNDPAASSERLAAAESWLESYSTSPGWRHVLSDWLILSKDEAGRQLDELRAQTHEREAARRYHQERERLYALRDDFERARRDRVGSEPALRDIEDDLDRLTLSPGPRSEELFQERRHLRNDLNAELLRVADDRFAEMERQNRNALGELESELAGFRSLAELEHLVQHWSGFGWPHPDAVLPVLRDRKAALDRTLTERLAEARLRRDYDELVEGEEVPGLVRAARLLADAERKGTAGREELRSDLIARLPGLLEGIVRRAREEQDWRRTWEELEQARFDADLKSVLAGSEGRLEAISEHVAALKEGLDRHLYEEARRHADPDELNRYLREAPLGTMTGPVRRRLDFVELDRAPQQVRLVVTIHWDQWFDGYKNSVVLTREGEPILLREGVVSRRGGYSERLVSEPFTQRLDEPTNLRIDVKVSDGTFVSRRPYGWAEEYRPLRDFAGRVWHLGGVKSNGAWVRLRIEGAAELAELPPWGG